MDNFVKIPATNYRLFISNVINLRQETNAASETVFFLEESQVKNVIIQGIVVYARSFPEKTYLVLDDNTGTIRCVQFLERLNTIRHQMTIGDLLRIKGRLGIYQNNLQIVTKGNPYIIDNFDEEII